MNRIKEWRKKKGLTQEELGNLINVQKAAISKYELGRAVPSTDILSKLSKYFGVTTDYLLELSDDPHGTMIPEGKGFYQHLMGSSGLAPKEEREIESDLEDMMNSMASAAYEANDAEKEDIEALKAALRLAMVQAKRIAKKKYTPKKYRKD